jgi:phage head maturation protease
MTKSFDPVEWTRRAKEKRTSSTFGAPKSFDQASRSVVAVLSKGTAVARSYGHEQLRISPSAVDLSRMEKAGSLPVLDSHVQASISSAIGRITRVWFDSGSLLGKIVFNQTAEGDRALGMVSRSEITSVSIGYQVDQWQIKDASGRVLDPEVDRIVIDGSLIFEAVKWRLLEASVVSVPADDEANFRSFPSGTGIGAVRATRARMIMRMRALGMRGYA